MITATTFFAQLNLKLYSVSYEILFVNTRNNVCFMLHISSISFFMKRRQSSRYAEYHVDVKKTIILRVFRFKRKILLLFYCFFVGSSVSNSIDSLYYFFWVFSDAITRELRD